MVSNQCEECPKLESPGAASPTLKVVVWETRSFTQEDAALFFHTFMVTAMEKSSAKCSRHPGPAPGVASRPCRAISTSSPSPRSNLTRPCPRVGRRPSVQFVCMDQSV